MTLFAILLVGTAALNDSEKMPGIMMLAFDRPPLDRIKGSGRLKSLEKQRGERGYIGGFFLGLFFALSFCPFSAVLFFWMLVPLAVAAKDPAIIPSIFAIATGLPAIVSSVVLSYCARRVGGLVDGFQRIQNAVRWLVAFVFLAAGLYYTHLAFF
ncbi:MAG: sulfite exporter TauE/SafE family protein [Candidatus Altiarchaeota archaeon]|nr:sulfite exporter TauE/SafE family protein [Candidatus Altiarchaeota archaeon]